MKPYFTKLESEWLVTVPASMDPQIGDKVEVDRETFGDTVEVKLTSEVPYKTASVQKTKRRFAFVEASGSSKGDLPKYGDVWSCDKGIATVVHYDYSNHRVYYAMPILDWDTDDDDPKFEGLDYGCMPVKDWLAEFKFLERKGKS